MKKQTQHSSVSDMVRNLSEDQAFTEEFEKRLSGRQLIKLLTVLRTRAGLSQKELAEKLGCKQSKVSKLESSDDAEIRFGDLIDCTEAVGYEMRVFLVPKLQKPEDDVRMHALLMKRILDRMVQLAGEDGEIVKAAACFLEETAFSLARLVQKANAGLPSHPEERSLPLQVEAPNVNGEQGSPGRNEKGNDRRS